MTLKGRGSGLELETASRSGGRSATASWCGCGSRIDARSGVAEFEAARPTSLCTVFDTLSDRLQDALGDVRSRGKLTEDDVNKAMRQVRLALLEADVNFKVVKEFTAAVKERALGPGRARVAQPRPAGGEDRVRGADRS